MSEYLRIAKVADFDRRRHLSVKLLGRLVGIIRRQDGTFFAIEAGCKHQGADLLTGYTGGPIAVCPRHQWRYDLETGACLDHDSPPLRRYGLRIEGEEIWVSLKPEEI